MLYKQESPWWSFIIVVTATVKIGKKLGAGGSLALCSRAPPNLVPWAELMEVDGRPPTTLLSDSSLSSNPYSRIHSTHVAVPGASHVPGPRHKPVGASAPQSHQLTPLDKRSSPRPSTTAPCNIGGLPTSPSSTPSP